MTFDDLKLRIEYLKDLKSLWDDKEKQIAFLKNKGWQACCTERVGEETYVRWGTKEVSFSTGDLFGKYVKEAESSADDLFYNLKNNG